jgi:transposase
MEITPLGLDLAKNVFQVHAISSTGEVVVRRTLRRAQVIAFFSKLSPCLVGMEACGTSHHWARELTGLGHEVRLMPPAYIKPYVKRGKTDASDAEAICEAVQRPTMRFLPIKSVDQQAALALHRTRDLLVRQRTQLVNMIRRVGPILLPRTARPQPRQRWEWRQKQTFDPLRRGIAVSRAPLCRAAFRHASVEGRENLGLVARRRS